MDGDSSVSVLKSLGVAGDSSVSRGDNFAVPRTGPAHSESYCRQTDDEFEFIAAKPEGRLEAVTTDIIISVVPEPLPKISIVATLSFC